MDKGEKQKEEKRKRRRRMKKEKTSSRNIKGMEYHGFVWKL